jgi:hypothetical protein
VTFVKGALNLIRDSQSFFTFASPLPVPILVIYCADIPPVSRTEMEALVALPGIEKCCLARGSLGVHDETLRAVAEAVLTFCKPLLAEAILPDVPVHLPACQIQEIDPIRILPQCAGILSSFGPVA